MKQRFRLITILIIVLMIIVSTLFSLYLKDLYILEVKEHLAQIDFQKQLIETRESNLANKAQNEKELEELNKSSNTLAIIEASDLAYAITELSDMSKEYEILERSFTINSRQIINEDENGGKLLKVNFRINGLGEYKNIMQYLQKLHEGLYYYIIDSITLREAWDSFITMELELALIAYTKDLEPENMPSFETDTDYQFANPFHK